MELRQTLWTRMATDLKIEQLDDLVTEVTLNKLPAVLEDILAGNVTGRTVVKFV